MCAKKSVRAEQGVEVLIFGREVVLIKGLFADFQFEQFINENAFNTISNVHLSALHDRVNLADVQLSK